MVKDDSENSKHQVFDYIDYAHAKEVVRDFPKIITIYTKLLPVLYEYAQYASVWDTIQTVESSKLLAEIQMDHYYKIYLRKGLKK